MICDDNDKAAPAPARAPAPTPTPKKSSLFGPSKFARPAARPIEDAHDEAISLFSRRDEVFANVVKQRQEEAAKKKERDRLTREKRESEAVQGEKRKRLSSEVQNESENVQLTSPVRRKSSSANSSKRSSPKSEQTTFTALKSEQTTFPSIPNVGESRQSPSFETHMPKSPSTDKQSQEPSVAPISLDSNNDDLTITKSSSIRSLTSNDDEDENIVEPNTTTFPPPEPEEDPAQFSEEEFPELVAVAKARQREQMGSRLAAARGRFLHPENAGSSDSKSSQIPSLSHPDSENDISMTMFVASNIPGTTPISIKRKLSQRLKDVRLKWIDKQLQNGQLTEEASSIFLSWRGIRVFDISTCRSMGINPDANGTLVTNGEGFRNGQIFLKAWTPELFNEWRTRKMASQERKLAGYACGDSGVESEPTAEERAAVEAEMAPKIRVILKAKDYEDCKLGIKSYTTFHRLASAFKKHHGLHEKQVQLLFDGSAVDPATTVEEAGLEDMDIVDVCISKG